MARLTQKEVEESTGGTGVSLGDKKSTKTEAVAYNEEGNKVDYSDKTAVAKGFTTAKGFEYWVTINRRNQLFNPNSKSYKDESLRLARQEGIEPYRLIKTSKQGFDNYVEFLKTKNIGALNQAEKGLI